MSEATISAVILTRDEADNIAACIGSLRWADEVLVVDSGSTDGTVEIARKAGARVEMLPDWPGYGVQRQRAQELARGDWVFMVDADERVTPALRDEILAVLREDRRDTVYLAPRRTWCFGGFIRHGGWYPDYVARLYPRALTRYDDAPVHERLVVPAGARTVRLRGELLHFTYRDLEHYLVKSARYAAAWAQARACRGRRAGLAEGLLHGLWCFLRMYVLRAGFLDGRRGLLLALLSAHSTFAKYADLWVRRQPPPPEDAP